MHPPAKKAKRQRNALIRLRPVLRWFLKLRSSPAAIAGGLGMGTFVALTPTVGLQFIGVVILATLFRVNRAASILPIWITNPVTVAPIYTFNYWIGLQFIDGPPLRQVSQIFVDIGKAMARMEIWQIQEQIKMMMDIGPDIVVPLCIGSCIVGALCGIIIYILSFRLLQLFSNRRKKRLLFKNR